MKTLFEKHKPSIQKELNCWLSDNNYEEVELNDEIIKDLLDELLCLLSSRSGMQIVMDDIDKDRMLGECDWCKEVEK